MILIAVHIEHWDGLSEDRQMDIADEMDTQDVVTISYIRLVTNKYVFHHVQIVQAGDYELDHYRLRLDACCLC